MPPSSRPWRINGEHADAAVAALDRLADAGGRTALRHRPARPHQGGRQAGQGAAGGDDRGAAAGRTPRPIEYKDADQDAARALVAADGGAVGFDRCRRHSRRLCGRPRRVGGTAGRRRGPAGHRRGVRDAVGSGPHGRWPPTRPRRADEARRAAGAAPGTGRAAGALRAGRGAEPATTFRPGWRRRAPSGRACRRWPSRWAADVQRRFDDAARAAERRHGAARGGARARRPGAGGRRGGRRAGRPPTTPRCAASGRRCGASGRRSAGLARSIRRSPSGSLPWRRPSRRASRSCAPRRQRGQEDNLHRLQAAVQALETRAAAESLSLKDADALIKDVKLGIGTMGPLPTPQDREDLTVRLQAVRAAVQPRLEELRNAEEWKRWANVQVQEDLCTQDGSAHSDGRGRARKGRHRDARAAGEVEAGRGGAALAGRGAVDALQGRAGRRSTRSARTSSRSRPPNARRR